MSEPGKQGKPEPIPFHRLFGLILMDFFTDSPFHVEVGKDLSIQQQLVDVVVVRKDEGEFSLLLPDGLAPLVSHNLISFKSFQDALDEWTMDELLGHSVDYRKYVSRSPRKEHLLPTDEFRLFAVCARYPEDLARKVAFTKVNDGVYDCPWGSKIIRVVVLNRLPEQPHNAMMHLFTAQPDLVRYGGKNYKQRSPHTSTLLGLLLQRYREEGVVMPYTLEDFEREYRSEILKLIPAEEILKGLSVDDLLAALPPETREALVRKLKAEEPPPKAE